MAVECAYIAPVFCIPFASGNGSWIKVTNCSVECGGGGIQVFVRDCPASANGGKECEGPTHKIEYCGYCPCKLWLPLHVMED